MPLPEDKFKYDLEPGYLEDQLFEDSLIEYVVGQDGLKIQLTPEGNAFFLLEECSHSEDEPRTKTPELSKHRRWPWDWIVLSLFILCVFLKIIKG